MYEDDSDSDTDTEINEDYYDEWIAENEALDPEGAEGTENFG